MSRVFLSMCLCEKNTQKTPKNKLKQKQKNNTLFNVSLITECFCWYILVFSTCKIFEHFISPTCNVKRGLGDDCLGGD